MLNLLVPWPNGYSRAKFCIYCHLRTSPMHPPCLIWSIPHVHMFMETTNNPPKCCGLQHLVHLILMIKAFITISWWLPVDPISGIYSHLLFVRFFPECRVLASLQKEWKHVNAWSNNKGQLCSWSNMIKTNGYNLHNMTQTREYWPSGLWTNWVYCTLCLRWFHLHYLLSYSLMKGCILTIVGRCHHYQIMLFTRGITHHMDRFVPTTVWVEYIVICLNAIIASPFVLMKQCLGIHYHSLCMQCNKFTACSPILHH